MSKKKIIIIIVILIAAGAIAIYWSTKKTATIKYKETIVTRSEIVRSILATGSVGPKNRLEIIPPVSGRVDKVLVAEGEYVKKGMIIAWMSSSERAALVDAARSQGTEEVKKWEELYRATPIIAPIDGTIIQRKVEVGQTFSNQAPVFVMSDRLTVKTQVDETDIAEVKLEQKATVILDAYPETTFDAHVIQLAYDSTVVNNVTTYIVDVVTDTTPPFMKSGMTANVTFIVEHKKDILVLPVSSINKEDGSVTVLMKDPHSKKPIAKKIEAGISNGKEIEIVSGLNEGDIVLTVDKNLGAETEKKPSLFRMGRH